MAIVPGRTGASCPALGNLSEHELWTAQNFPNFPSQNDSLNCAVQLRLKAECASVPSKRTHERGFGVGNEPVICHLASVRSSRIFRRFVHGGSAVAMQLNPQQEQVASHTLGRILTLAGPGSGKTRTLTERTGRLIKARVKPENILCLTFTNKARNEMRDRLAASIGEPAKKVVISNFHGLCGMLLRRFGSLLGYNQRMTIADSDDQVDLMMQIARHARHRADQAAGQGAFLGDQ